MCKIRVNEDNSMDESSNKKSESSDCKQLEQQYDYLATRIDAAERNVNVLEPRFKEVENKIEAKEKSFNQLVKGIYVGAAIVATIISTASVIVYNQLPTVSNLNKVGDLACRTYEDRRTEKLSGIEIRVSEIEKDINTFKNGIKRQKELYRSDPKESIRVTIEESENNLKSNSEFYKALLKDKYKLENSVECPAKI